MLTGVVKHAHSYYVFAMKIQEIKSEGRRLIGFFMQGLMEIGRFPSCLLLLTDSICPDLPHYATFTLSDNSNTLLEGSAQLGILRRIGAYLGGDFEWLRYFSFATATPIYRGQDVIISGQNGAYRGIWKNEILLKYYEWRREKSGYRRSCFLLRYPLLVQN